MGDSLFLAAGLYTPEATSWVKIKNRAYSQAEGADFFDGLAFRGGRVATGTRLTP